MSLIVCAIILAQNDNRMWYVCWTRATLNTYLLSAEKNEGLRVAEKTITPREGCVSWDMYGCRNLNVGGSCFGKIESIVGNMAVEWYGRKVRMNDSVLYSCTLSRGHQCSVALGMEQKWIDAPKSPY